jgi:hypothetical protein
VLLDSVEGVAMNGIEDLLKKTAWELHRAHINRVMDDLEKHNEPKVVMVYPPAPLTLDILRNLANEVLRVTAQSTVALAGEWVPEDDRPTPSKKGKKR